MSKSHVLTTMVVLTLMTGCAAAAPRKSQPVRTMGVTKGPELVFGRPVADVLPVLAGAEPTGNNGRVGGEFVFWSYRLADGRDVLFHACAPLDGVDCAARARLICAKGREPQFLDTARNSGEVRRMQCLAVGQAAPGELHPGCAETEFDEELIIGLASCP